MNIGFLRGAYLAGPHRIMEGTGKLIRHVKIRLDEPIDAEAIKRLLLDAYADMRRQVEGEAQAEVRRLPKRFRDRR